MASSILAPERRISVRLTRLFIVTHTPRSLPDHTLSAVNLQHALGPSQTCNVQSIDNHRATMTIAPPKETIRVAIIGAGASGLSQIKQLLDAFERDDVRASGKELVVVCYEKGREVGGVWYVDEERVKGQSKPYLSVVLPVDTPSAGRPHGQDDDADKDGGNVEGHKQEMGRLVIFPKVHDEGDEPSAMYDGLRTNLPHVRYGLAFGLESHRDVHTKALS